MKTIIVPVDFSPITGELVQRAAELAAVVGGTVILAHVTAPLLLRSESGPLAGAIVERESTARRDARRKLERLRTGLVARFIHAEIAPLEGFAAAEILELAEERKADYIVLGSHGRTALLDLLVGSTAHGILKGARCPVVIVPAPKPPLKRGARLVRRCEPARLG